ncbi:hypothetical protein GGR50DRAFT_570615 [Xylaria sp. CBS 124048]|nr:hypothetical protein GGR50DRAFT_570615 [Xylaria sp. CBS 124048]
MAEDPLESVISNVPDWLKRLEELDGQIEQRQEELAKFAAGRPASSGRSIRNRGSTESLRPRDNDVAPPQTPERTTDQNPQPQTTAAPPQIPEGQHHANPMQSPSSPASDPWSGSSLMRHTTELVATAQRRARATVRRKQKTESMMSGDGAVPKYRSRRMVLVYYDSYVQSFFEELVKFVSSQRNLIRKAKMAAKVAHIRQLADFAMPDNEANDDTAGEPNIGNVPVVADPAVIAQNSGQVIAADMKLSYLDGQTYSRGPLMNSALKYMPRRGMTSALRGRLGAFNEKGDFWDEMDGGLEHVQGMCERAAHQFLRDGDCNEEIGKIKDRLNKVKELAMTEKERPLANSPQDNAQQETNTAPAPAPEPEPEPNQSIVPDFGQAVVPEPVDVTTTRDLPKGDLDAEPIKTRTFRPSTMRRGSAASIPTKVPTQQVIQPGVPEIDEGIEVDVDDFKPVYRSTRQMRRPF